jgi:heme-degrading monooxygenase HmoA
MLAWRNQPDHREAQELGKKLFYSEYRIQVCQPIRDYSFPKKNDAPPGSV